MKVAVLKLFNFNVKSKRMGKVITVMNMKGGVGKTTACIHVAGIIANFSHPGHEKIKKVLVIDYDPQFNLSQAFLKPAKYFELEKQRKTTMAILMDDELDMDPFEIQVPGNHMPPSVADIVTNIVNYKDGRRLDIVPATLDLMFIALGQASTQLKPIEERFRKFIDECKKVYDLILIDCHPAGSLFTKTSLRNSDHVLIPVVPQQYAARGIGLMLKFIEAKKVGKASPTPHILFNRTSRIGVSAIEAAIRANKDYSKICMVNTLKHYSAFQDPEGGGGFAWNSGKPYSTEAYFNARTVTRELLKRIEE